MKHSFLTILTCLSMIAYSATSCEKKTDSNNIENNNPIVSGKIKIKINSQTFMATLLDNNSAKAFKDMLPITINMNELNRSEKYYDLPTSLPTHSSNPKTIQNGNIMLYGSKTLVLFYKTFSTAYSYTKLGSIEDVTGLASALGSENVTVTFELDTTQ